MRSTRAPRIAALAALAVASVVTLLVLTGAAGGTYELRARFDDVRGLIAGGEVRAGAVTVGSVSDVAIGPDDRPVVTMEIEEGFPVFEGATADIRLASNVGAVNRTVELVQGDESAARLPDGAVLTVRETDQPVNFDEAVETLDPRTRAATGELIGGLRRSLDGRGADLDLALDHAGPALAETAALLAQVNQDGEALRTVVGDGERVVSALAERPNDLGAAAERLAALLDTTARRQAELGAGVRELAPALRAGRGTLDALTGAVPDLRRLAAEVDPLTAELGPFLRLVPDLTQSTEPLLEATRQLVADAPGQLQEIRPIARAANPIAGKLTDVGEQALPLARVLQVYVPETVGAFQNFGATAGAYDANGHILNTVSAVAPSPPSSATAAGEIGPADCDAEQPSKMTPGLLAPPFIRVPGLNECQPWTDLPSGILPEDGAR